MIVSTCHSGKSKIELVVAVRMSHLETGQWMVGVMTFQGLPLGPSFCHQASYPKGPTAHLNINFFIRETSVCSRAVIRLTIGQHADHAVVSLEWRSILYLLHSRLREHLGKGSELREHCRRGAEEILQARLERGQG